MREGAVFVSGVFAGTISELDGEGYVFTYDNAYLSDQSCPAVSLTLPKMQKTYRSPHLFPFFANMLSEGSNRAVQSMLHHIDADDAAVEGIEAPSAFGANAAAAENQDRLSIQLFKITGFLPTSLLLEGAEVV